MSTKHKEEKKNLESLNVTYKIYYTGMVIKIEQFRDIFLKDHLYKIKIDVMQGPHVYIELDPYG